MANWDWEVSYTQDSRRHRITTSRLLAFRKTNWRMADIFKRHLTQPSDPNRLFGAAWTADARSIINTVPNMISAKYVL